MELTQRPDRFVGAAQKASADALESMATNTAWRDVRQRCLTLGETRNSHFKLGVLRFSATVFPPHICARLTQLAAGIEVLPVGDTYRTNDPVKSIEYR